MGLNYHYLRYFWAVAHEGNLTRAARKLHVSQSALSVQIQKLEDELGHPLFERRGKRLLLTEAGRVTLEHADSIFGIGDDLLRTLSGFDNSERRVLRIGALATLSRNFQIQFVAPLIARDIAKNDVELVIRSGAFGELLNALEAYRLDVVLANSAPARDAATRWVPHPIAEQPVSLVAHPGVEAAGSLRETLERHPVVLPTAESSIRAGFDALTLRLGVTPRIAAEIDDMAMLRLVARAHKALAVVPPIVVNDELVRGELLEIHRLPELTETFFAITLKRSFENPLLASLLGER
ncbi:MAG: LysR family transcriptional regulator [Myxococcota bacterium]